MNSPESPTYASAKGRAGSDRFRSILLGLVLLIAVLPPTAHALIGLNIRFIADDFCSAAIAKAMGIFQAVGYWYLNWSGRFAASFFDAVVGFLGPSNSPFSTLSIVLLWLMTIAWLFTRVICWRSPLRRWLASSIAAAVILTACFQVTPDLPQSLYWG